MPKETKQSQKAEGPQGPNPVPTSIVTPPTPGGAPSATVQERERASGAEQERLDSLESRGALEEPEGTYESDFPANDSKNKPQGLQAEPAEFATNGAVVMNMVPSPSGPVPVSTLAASRSEEKQILEARRQRLEREGRRSLLRELSDEEIDQLDGAMLRTIAQQRGYENFPQAGTRTSREAFRRFQRDDENLEVEKSSKSEK